MTRYDADLGYAAGSYAASGAARRRNRRAMLAFGASAGAVALFTGIVVASFGGGDSVVHTGGVPLIQADSTPYKLRPKDPGGMEVPYQDKLVYQRLNPGPQRPTVEHLLPPPEQPLPRPVVTPALPPAPELPAPPALAQIVPPPGATATVPRGVDEGDALPQAYQTADGSLSLVPEEEPATGYGTYAPEEAPPPPPPPAKIMGIVPPPPTPAAAPVRVAAPPATLPSKPPPGQNPAPAAVATGGGWRVQLASVRSEAEAQSEWKRLAGRYASALAGLSPQISRADLGDRGVYYRVRGGTVDEQRARAICADLKSQNVGCVVVRP